MSRRDDDRPRRPYEKDDYRDGPPRKASNAAAWIVVAVVGAGLVGVALIVGLGWFFVAARPGPAVAPPAATAHVLGPIDSEPAAAKVFTKKEFEELVLKKTKDQIIAAVGRPDTTTDQVPGPAPGVISFLKEYWYFRERVMNPDTAKPYMNARLYIDTVGNAYRIDYP